MGLELIPNERIEEIKAMLSAGSFGAPGNATVAELLDERECLLDVLSKAQETIAQLNEVLEFYAEPGNYLEHIIGRGPKIPVIQDGGRRARAVLEVEEGAES